MKITVLAKPGGRAELVEKITENNFKISVRARAADGAANLAIAAALAKYLGVAKSRVTLVHGARGKTKIFEVL